MNIWLLYIIIAAILVVAELGYFRIADKYNIIGKPKDNTTSTIARRGGGVVFMLSIVIWGVMMLVLGNEIWDYLPFLCGSARGTALKIRKTRLCRTRSSD